MKIPKALILAAALCACAPALGQVEIHAKRNPDGSVTMSAAELEKIAALLNKMQAQVDAANEAAQEILGKAREMQITIAKQMLCA